jgi:hypothetical protein
MTVLPPKVEEALLAFRDHFRLNNMPIPDEGFIRSAAARMLEGVQNQPDLPEDRKIRAQVDAILIEDALRELENAPNRSLLVSAIWAALNLGHTSGPGLPSDYIERLYAQMRSAENSAAGKKSGAARRERPWWSTARDRALQEIAKSPNASDEKIAEEIRYYWPGPEEAPKCPGSRTLTRFISKRRGKELPARTGS